MKRKVLISERAMDEIESRAGDVGGEVAGGLLIGYPTAEGYWVERVLACRNAANPEERHGHYEVDSTVLANVRTTLERSHLSVLGIFYSRATRGSEQPSGREELRLVPTTNGHGRTPPRVWLDADGAASVDLEAQVLPKRERAIAFCPD